MSAAATLNQLKPGQAARVARLTASDPVLLAKLREIGFSEGDEVELITFGPFGGQPIAVRLNRTLIALRRAEAAAIEIIPQAQFEAAQERIGEPVAEPVHG